MTELERVTKENKLLKIGIAKAFIDLHNWAAGRKSKNIIDIARDLKKLGE